MGSAKRSKPRRLPEKLFAVREKLGASQIEMARLLEPGMSSARISEYERGIREPSLLVLLAYARLAGVTLEQIVDDDLDLTVQTAINSPIEIHGKWK